MSDVTSDEGEGRERTSDRPPTISSLPPDFDDAPGGETKQTPKEELARWRRMAARGRAAGAAEVGYETLLDQEATRQALRASERPPVVGTEEVTRVALPIELPPSPNAPAAPRVEPPTRELELASDMVALSRQDAPTREPSSSAPTLVAIALPPSPPPSRPALRPVASSLPPNVPPMPTPALGVSLPPGVTVSAPPRAPSSMRPTLIAVAVIVLALIGAAAMLLWPRADPFLGAGAASPALSAPNVAAPAATAPVATAPTATAPAATAPAATAPAATEPAATAPVATAPTATAPTATAPTATAPAATAPTATEPAATTPAAIAPIVAPATTGEPESVAALLAAGDEALEARDYLRALSIYQQATALDSHDPYAFAGAARACLGLSRTADAVRFAERAVANRQRRAAFRVLLGDAHRANGSNEAAREAWERALELDPDDATARARLAE